MANNNFPNVGSNVNATTAISGLIVYLQSELGSKQGKIVEGRRGVPWIQFQNAEQKQHNARFTFMEDLYTSKKHGVTSENFGGLYTRLATGDTEIYPNLLDKDIADIRPRDVAYYCSRNDVIPSTNKNVLAHSGSRMLQQLHKINLARNVGIPASEAQFNEQYAGHDFSNGLPEELIQGVDKAIKLEASGTIPDKMAGNFWNEWSKDLHVGGRVSYDNHTEDATSRSANVAYDKPYKAGTGENLVEYVNNNYSIDGKYTDHGKRLLLVSFANDSCSNLSTEFPTGIKFTDLPEVQAVSLNSKERQKALKKQAEQQKKEDAKAKFLKEQADKWEADNK